MADFHRPGEAAIFCALTPDPESMVGSYYWANDERVVVGLVDQDGSLPGR